MAFFLFIPFLPPHALSVRSPDNRRIIDPVNYNKIYRIILYRFGMRVIETYTNSPTPPPPLSYISYTVLHLHVCVCVATALLQCRPVCQSRDDHKNDDLFRIRYYRRYGRRTLVTLRFRRVSRGRKKKPFDFVPGRTLCSSFNRTIRIGRVVYLLYRTARRYPHLCPLGFLR